MAGSNNIHWYVGELALEAAVKIILVCEQSENANSAPPVIVAVGSALMVTEIVPLDTLVQPNAFVAITV